MKPMRAAALGPLLALALSACGSAASSDASLARLLEDARAAAVPLDDPLALDDATIAETRKAVGRRGQPLERLRRLDAWLRHGRGELRYDPDPHLDAQATYRERRGDCMAYSLLFVAAARALGIPTRFLHATELESHAERHGSFYVASHVAVGYGLGPREVVFDFTAGRVTSLRVSTYEPIDDATAVALHYSNVAARRMAEGALAEARRLLEVVARGAPAVPEPLNNLAVALQRLGRPVEALAVLDDGLQRFPRYPPLYTNAVDAARAAGLRDRARAYEERGREVAQRDPFFLFARGLRLYEAERYPDAAEELERACEVAPESSILHAWRARAHLAAGDLGRARAAYVRARDLAPTGAAVRQLERELPDLAVR